MKGNKLKLLLSIPAVIACILFGCEKKEKVLLTDISPVKEADPAVLTAEEEPLQVAEADKELIVVHICGAVESPGVYELPVGSRIYQGIQAAGGFSSEARQDFLNQAQVLQDGIRLYVPTVDEVDSESTFEHDTSSEDKGLVNINTATEEELCTLSGIGSGKAQSIITYRTKNGSFKSIEDIMNVEGIKDGLFQKIRDSITV